MQQAPDWIEKLPQLPQLAFDVLQQSKQQHILLEQRMLNEQKRQQLAAKKQTKKRMMIGVLLLLSAYVGYEPARELLQQIEWQGWLLAMIAFVVLIR
jgi:ubiquinone biosynthesis protein